MAENMREKQRSPGGTYYCDCDKISCNVLYLQFEPQEWHLVLAGDQLRPMDNAPFL